MGRHRPHHRTLGQEVEVGHCLDQAMVKDEKSEEAGRGEKSRCTCRAMSRAVRWPSMVDTRRRSGGGGGGAGWGPLGGHRDSRIASLGEGGGGEVK